MNVKYSVPIIRWWPWTECRTAPVVKVIGLVLGIWTSVGFFNVLNPKNLHKCLSSVEVRPFFHCLTSLLSIYFLSVHSVCVSMKIYCITCWEKYWITRCHFLRQHFSLKWKIVHENHFTHFFFQLDIFVISGTLWIWTITDNNRYCGFKQCLSSQHDVVMMDPQKALLGWRG